MKRKDGEGGDRRVEERILPSRKRISEAKVVPEANAVGSADPCPCGIEGRRGAVYVTYVHK